MLPLRVHSAATSCIHFSPQEASPAARIRPRSRPPRAAGLLVLRLFGGLADSRFVKVVAAGAGPSVGAQVQLLWRHQMRLPLLAVSRAAQDVCGRRVLERDFTFR